MPAIEHRDMSAPDEVRTPDKTTLEVVSLAGASAARLTLQPGWRWSTECVSRPRGFRRAEACQGAHTLGCLVSGRMHVVADDGTEADLAGGESYRLEPGHRRVGRRRRPGRRARVRDQDGGDVRPRLDPPP